MNLPKLKVDHEQIESADVPLVLIVDQWGCCLSDEQAAEVLRRCEDEPKKQARIEELEKVLGGVQRALDLDDEFDGEHLKQPDHACKECMAERGWVWTANESWEEFKCWRHAIKSVGQAGIPL